MRIGGGFHFGFSIADDIATAEVAKQSEKPHPVEYIHDLFS